MQYQLPLVSIGMPTYNRGEYIPAAINSLLNQSYKNFELIISDNASTDKTRKICVAYAQKDKRIRYIRQASNIGPLNNFQFVLNMAKGKYFMWASDDDFWYKDFITTILGALMENNDRVIGFCNYIYFNTDSSVKKIISINNNLSMRNRLIEFLENYQHLLGSLYYGIFKTDILRSIGGIHRDSRPYYKAGDSLTMFKVLLLGNFIHVNKILFKKRDTSGFLYNDYKTLKNLNFSPPVMFRIRRYLYTPVIILFDYYYFTLFTLKSNMKISDKIIISAYCLKRLGKSYVQFVSKIFNGIYYVILGLLEKHVFNYRASIQLDNPK